MELHTVRFPLVLALVSKMAFGIASCWLLLCSRSAWDAVINMV